MYRYTEERKIVEEDEEIDGYVSQVVNKKSPRKTVHYSDIFD